MVVGNTTNRQSQSESKRDESIIKAQGLRAFGHLIARTHVDEVTGSECNTGPVSGAPQGERHQRAGHPAEVSATPPPTGGGVRGQGSVAPWLHTRVVLRAGWAGGGLRTGSTKSSSHQPANQHHQHHLASWTGAMDDVDESTLLAAYQLDSADPQGWSTWDNQDGDADVGAGWDHESDPLGLLAKLPSTKDFDPSVRPTLSLHSKGFDAKSFLAQVHPDATFVDLSHGLAHLRANIEQRSEALKVLVQDNFDRFVAVKATNDGVFREMRQHVNGPLRPEAD